MTDECSEPSEAEVSSLGDGFLNKGMTPEQAVEARIAAAREAVRGGGDFYAGDAGNRSRTPKEQPRQPIKLGYSQPTGEADVQATPVAPPAVVREASPSDSAEELQAKNAALQAQVESLKVSQGEATAAVLAAQHRHEANLVKLREKQAKQSTTLQEKDAKIAHLTALVDELRSSREQSVVSEAMQRDTADKLRQKESMIAKMRLALEKQATEKRTLETMQQEKTRQYKELIGKVDSAARQQKAVADPDIEAVLSEVTIADLPAEGIACIDRLTALVFQTKSEVKRLRVQLAARSNSPGPVAERTGSPATRGRVERMGGGSSRTASPAGVGASGVPSSRIMVKQAPKGDEAWKLWNERKKRETLSKESVRHDRPWKGGGLAKRPSARAPSPGGAKQPSQVERSGTSRADDNPQPTVTTFPEQQQQQHRTASPQQIRVEKREPLPPQHLPHGLLALVGNSSRPATPRAVEPSYSSPE